jgi:hypothetical protein
LLPVAEVILIENLFAIIVFMVFLLLRMLGQKNTPPPPRRGQRPPVPDQEADMTEPRPGRAEPRPPVKFPRPVARREAEDEDFFPLPDDLREIFGLPPRDNREIRPEKPKPAPEPAVEPMPAVSPQLKGDGYQAFLAASEQPRPAGHAGSQQLLPRKSNRAAIPGLGIPISKEAIIQGVIWAEVLNNPRNRRNKRHLGRM